jgi:hypothetical protein
LVLFQVPELARRDISYVAAKDGAYTDYTGAPLGIFRHQRESLLSRREMANAPRFNSSTDYYCSTSLRSCCSRFVRAAYLLAGPYIHCPLPAIMPFHQIKREPVTPAPVLWRCVACCAVEVNVTAGCGYQAETLVVFPSFKRSDHNVHPNGQPAPPAAPQCLDLVSDHRQGVLGWGSRPQVLTIERSVTPL